MTQFWPEKYKGGCGEKHFSLMRERQSSLLLPQCWELWDHEGMSLREGGHAEDGGEGGMKSPRPLVTPVRVRDPTLRCSTSGLAIVCNRKTPTLFKDACRWVSQYL